MEPDATKPEETRDARPEARAGGPVRVRAWAGVVFAGAMALLVTAAWLRPDPRGFGTHQQFGGGMCGMLLTTRLPCPTCGMTTAFAHTIRGQFLRAFLAQPAGFALALATIATALGASWTIVTGRAPVLELWRITPYRLFLGLLFVFVCGWGFKLLYGLATGALPLPP